ncbi:MAG: FAD-dependent oxidoreductase, partial [Oscillospiraceae bacterium]|nr:FAD-dependent oxidoreductase [Oscillospiraceae bacterium]
GYDKLLIATGSSPLRFPIAGIEQVQAWSAFTTLDDTRYLDAHVSGDTRVFIIGAGLIGLKCAEGLAERAKSVTVCDLAETILSSILTPKPAKIMQTHLERQGIAFQLGTSVDRFETIDGGYAAIMKNGEIVTFDMLVFAAGVRPNIALVKEAGGAADRGILTNENARTSLPDIYAAGDCTESVDTVTGQRKIMALLPNAYHQGEAAGIHMAGGEHPFTDAIPMNAIGFFGKHILSAGVYTDGEAFESETNGAYRCFYYDERAQRLLGFILIDDAARAGIYTALVREKTQLSKDLFLRLREEPGLIAFSTETRAAVLRNPKKEDTQCK